MVEKVNENITEEQRDILMDTLMELSSVDTFALEAASERLDNQFDASELGSFIYHDLGRSFIKKKKKDNKVKQVDRTHSDKANANEEVQMDIGEGNRKNTNENEEVYEQPQDLRESHVDEQSNSQQRKTSERPLIPPALRNENNSRLTISPNIHESPVPTSELNEVSVSKRERSDSEEGVDLREEGVEEEVNAEEGRNEDDEVDQLDELNQPQLTNSENQSEDRPVKMEEVQEIEHEDQDQGTDDTAQEEQVRRKKETKQAKRAKETEPVGPVKRKRVEFSREDDNVIVAFLRRYKNNQKGNSLWKKLGEKRDNHSFHSWRERYVKRMSDFNKRVENEEYALADFGIYMTSDEEDNGYDSDGAFSDPDNSLNKRRMGRENIVKGETSKETRERIAREKQAHYKKRTGQPLHKSDNDEQEIEVNEIKMAPGESPQNIVDNVSAASPEIKQEPTDENSDGGNEVQFAETNAETEPPGSTQMLIDAASKLEDVQYVLSPSEHSEEEIDEKDDEAHEESIQLFNQFLNDYPISKTKLEDLLSVYDYNFKNVKKVLDQANAK
ncbi:hypothetical protein E3Q22_00292 [Wallemia mellicola]|uniref:TERF2-interacting telomeric protein 1 Myb domain-containing protein n=1 Tax=Wallemia mellicola TaxID=1708541 RepID=A0A4T0TU49_9BASI|nr:hypothetical protein E3Q23_00822 [Wallemia mellicola]TIB82465.1 hypothetical protein E3Q22_00292 [Wallemia mellicola]TIC20989.1 hypothetical protein E3Q13_00053 [Wallemia mellicola]TIC68710.1 hypothetical protein E3Q01_00703 [Wallemia mellicola]